MPFFAAQNLCSKAVSPCVPWHFQASIPDGVKGAENKKARDKWLNTPTTVHQCYTAYEGIISTERLSEAKTGSEGNPPLKLYAFVGDYDAPLTLDEIKIGIERHQGFMPNYLERTLSGNVRLVWLFQKEVSFPSLKFCKEFLKRALVATKFNEVAVGLDVPAWETPNRLWSNSSEWLVIDENARIPHALLNGWIIETAERHHWKKDRGAVDIPLPVVFSELEKKYPNLNAIWPGDFVEGAQGPSFFIEGSESPKSAIVKPTGIFTFAAHATKPFWSWADLLGKTFVERYETELMGKAVTDIYFDGKSYWRKDGPGNWKPFPKEDTASYLKVFRGLSAQGTADEPSEIERGLQHIQMWQGINGAAPFVFQPPGVITRSNNLFLNTFSGKTVRLAGEKPLWGPRGNMLFLSTFFGGLLATPSARPSFDAWSSRFFRGAYDQNLESGHILFMLGGPGIGKTLWLQAILAKLVGGCADAQDYLMGQTNFNAQLFQVPLWCVDDSSATVDTTTHRKFSSMTKKMAANSAFQYSEKFRTPCMVDWLGRVVVLANSDEESVRIVPDLSITIMDKLCLFLAADKPWMNFPSRREIEQLLEPELPFYARYLYEFEVPPECAGASRYGLKPYHEPSLLKAAEQSSRTSSFLEIIEDWSERFFAENKGAECWEGTAFQFLRELNRDEASREAGLRSMSSQAVGYQMAALKAKGYPIVPLTEDTGGSRKWRIMRPEPNKETSLPVGTKFSK